MCAQRVEATRGGNTWRNSASSLEANNAWEENLNVSAQNESNETITDKKGSCLNPKNRSDGGRGRELLRRGRAQQVEHRDQVRDVTYETLKTKLREVLEKTQELSKEEGKDDIQLRDFAARFDRLDTTVQLQQGAGSLEAAQLESRAAVEAKDEEAAKRGLAKLSELLNRWSNRSTETESGQARGLEPWQDAEHPDAWVRRSFDIEST